MKAMCGFSYKSSAPRTVQYQSTICGRRLVCSTRCDNLFGDAMISSLAQGIAPGSVHGNGAEVNRNAAGPRPRPAGPKGSLGAATAPRLVACRSSAAAFFLLVDLAQVAFKAHALHRVPLPVHAGAQLLRLAAQPAAPLPALRAVARLTRPRPDRGTGASAEIAAERAVAVADIAGAAINPGKRAALLGPIARPAARDERIAFHPSAAAAAEVSALRQTLRLRRQ